ncbi:DNJC4 protein, partial [Amia calva]|nr:DNJC4 protein [Amia calva]
LHPDSDPSNPGLHAQFVALSEAYRVLSRETSRREYDTQLRARHRHWDRQTHTAAPHYSSESSEHVRYSEQFRYAPPQDLSPDQLERKRKRNLRLVGYCMLAMIGSIVAHYFGFRKLEEMHNSFMEEKDRAITEIYNTSKERARVNGFQKQTAILRQKHAEFVEKYQRREERGTDDK